MTGCQRLVRLGDDLVKCGRPKFHEIHDDHRGCHPYKPDDEGAN